MLRLSLAVATATCSFALAASAGLFGPTATATAADDPPFTAVQADLFAVPNSYSNAWGDYDNDGDLDLAVSLGSGEVRLYRNDAGTFVSVGAQLGMPQAGSYELRGLSWGDYDGDGFINLLGGDGNGQAETRDKNSRSARSADDRAIGTVDELVTAQRGG